MELALLKNKKGTLLHPITGMISFLCGIFSLVELNINYLFLSSFFLPQALYSIPVLGIFSGMVALFTRRSKMYAWWGIGLNIFVLLFSFVILILAWSINPKP
ncbi:hypothetical protein UY416_01835 [Paenibacillus polymyxa]|uniref:hypothetical protein n=1 Tax=Paenibacillus polymyxa TaxID=1406 RepID=UPI002AB57EF5|nr:hypothetical protein [Paenibacillus polymyxa]MDY8045034.1 hypothetical protein [Paenibacillus polymyxa]